MCRVESDLGPKEASIVVSVLHSPHSGPTYTSGEVVAEPTGTALSGTEKDACDFSRAIRMQGHLVSLCCLLWKPEVWGGRNSSSCLKLPKALPVHSSVGFHAKSGVRLIWVQIWALPFINLEVVLQPLVTPIFLFWVDCAICRRTTGYGCGFSTCQVRI